MFLGTIAGPLGILFWGSIGALTGGAVGDTGRTGAFGELVEQVKAILLLASLFEKLPSATLGAVVIDAMVGLTTLAGLKRYYRVNRADWVFFIGAGLGILFFGIIQGILIGVVLSLLLLIARASRTSVRRLGYDPDAGTYHAVARSEGLETTPGVLVARIDGPLFFADADRFRARIHELAQDEASPIRIVIDADAVHLTDTDGADILIQVARELQSRGASLALARVHPPILALCRRAGLMDVIGDDAVFETVRDAVDAVTPLPSPAPARPPASS